MFTSKLSYFLGCALLLINVQLDAQKVNTSVHGVVKDSISGEKLAYATITFEGVGVGTRSDINGNFYLETPKSPLKIKITYVGFQAQTIGIKPNAHNEVQVFLNESSSALKETIIRPKKYSRKNNPAVDLVEEVFKHKDENRKEGLDFYSVLKYEKLQIDLNNITDDFRKKWYFKPFRFIFNNVDTNAITHKVALPIYLRERLLEAYYRKDPRDEKALLMGVKQSGFSEEEEDDNLGIDGDGVSSYLNSTFADVDIYEPRIQLLGTEFVGPLSGIANTMYRFYILDTVEFNGKKYADLFFAPRNKADLAFMGNMLVALDSTYAVMKVEMGVAKDANLNFVSDLHIEQIFERMDDGAKGKLMLVEDHITVDMKILKSTKGRSFLTHKSSYYSNYSINEPLPDSLFKGTVPIREDTGLVKKRTEAWWQEHRPTPLTGAERFVDLMVDSMKQVRAYKIMEGTGKLLGTGYQRIGFVDIGMISSVYSFNDVEGTRIRLGIKTNSKLFKPLVLKGYGAYGFTDRKWKYETAAVYSLNGKVPMAFPQHQISISYQRDLRIPGLSLERISQDNTALSIQRAANNRMLLNSVMKLEYKQEFKNQFSYNIVLLQKQFNAAGSLAFELSDNDPDVKNYAESLQTSEAGLYLRWAPRQQFYNGPTYRYAVPGKWPIFSLTWKNGFKGIGGGQYNFQKLNISAEKRLFVAPFGYSDWTLTGARTWGSVPYPLLEIHPANQSYFYDWYAYNLMNFMEFVSDKYVALNVQHNFNGLFFNKVPLLKKLQWRENFSFKGIYGGIDDRNNPELTTGLFKFPKDTNGNSITQSLGRKPYIEMSVGISNLFRVIRVDYVWRVNYNELPGTSQWGIRAMFAPKF